MKMTGISRKIRRILPFVILMLVVYNSYVYWNKKEIAGEVVLPEFTERTFDAPTPEPSGVWILAESFDPQMCVALAAAFPEWNIFLVLPTQTDLTHSRCRFLALNQVRNEISEELLSLFAHSTSHLLLAIGARYIIQYNPKIVFVGPTENLQLLERPFHLDVSDENRLVYNNENQPTLFPADQHFGCNLNNTTYLTHNMYKYCKCPPPAIQAAAVPGLTDKKRISDVENVDFSDVENGGLLCDSAAPTVVLERDNYALVTFNGGLFRYGFIWAAAIDMIAVAANERRLLINMGVQKIIWQMGSNIKIFIDDTRMGKHVEQMSGEVQVWMELIKKWSCTDNLVQSCILNLMLYLRNVKMLKQSTFRIIQQYLSTMIQNGYIFPDIFPVEEQLATLQCDKEPVIYHPLDFFELKKNAKFLPINNVDQLKQLHHVTCDVTEIRKLADFSLTSPWIQFKDIILLVVFNKPHFEALPYVELLYASFFPRMVFCGPELPDVSKFSHLYSRESGLLNRTFISYGGTPDGHVPGAFNYACFTKLINMQFDVAGYLVIADDTLLLVNNIKDFRRDSIWFLPKKEMRIGEITKLKECKLGMCDFFPHWAWWEDYQTNTLSLLNYMEEQQKYSPLIYKCYHQLVHLNGAPLRPSGGYSDVYYIPQRLERDFAQLSSLFLEYEIFLEIAVPTIIRCLEYPDDVVAMENKISWDEDRDQPWKYFTKHHLFGKAFYHPAKWGYLTLEETSVQFKKYYCNKVLPFLHDPLERLPKDLRS